MRAAEQAEAASGWREAIVWLARATIVHPIAPAGAYRLLRVLETANQFESIGKILEIFQKGGVFPDVRGVFRGVLLLHGNDPKGALQSLSKLPTRRDAQRRTPSRRGSASSGRRRTKVSDTIARH